MTASPVSRLTLGRYLAGELDQDEAAAIAAAIDSDPALAAQVERVDRAKEAVAPLDLGMLRARAGVAAPAPANDNRAFLAVIPVLLAAAVALFFVIPSVEVAEEASGLRGSSVLQVYHLEPAGLAAYDQRALGAGDVLGFKVDPGTKHDVVLLSVDGRGAVTVHYPDSGEGSEPLNSTGVQALPGSLILDDAPGPEVFVAVFGRTAAEARSEAQRAWQAGGTDGLQDWARSNDVDLTVVERR